MTGNYKFLSKLVCVLPSPQGQLCRPVFRPGRLWLYCFPFLLSAALSFSALAHDSTSAVETEIAGREKYLEPVDILAPVFALQDADANPVRLDDFRGKVVILNFLYSRCQEQCPLHSLKLAEVQQQLALAAQSERVQFITVATDTEDAASTAESMRAHGLRYGLDPANWVYLHGGEGQEDLGLRLAAGYGLKFVPTGDGEQMHGVISFLIDTGGRLRARYHGLGFKTVNLTLHAAALAHDDHNKGAGNLADAPPALSRTLSIGLFAVTLLLIIGACAIAIYYWKRRQRDSNRLAAEENIQ